MLPCAYSNGRGVGGANNIVDKCKLCGSPTNQMYCDDCLFDYERQPNIGAPIFWAVVASTLALLLILTIKGCSAETLGFRNPIVAQEKATCANVLLAVQLTDAATTRGILARGGYERNPLARPFVQSNIGAYTSAIVANVIARIVTRHSPSLMCVAASVEFLAVANNVRVLDRWNDK